MYLSDSYPVNLKIPWESGVSRIPPISPLMFLVNALPMIRFQECLFDEEGDGG